MPRDIGTADGDCLPRDVAGGEPARVEELARHIARITEENQKLFNRLVEDERRYRRLARAVWKVQEEERRRMALELHDGVGQTLTALKHQLQRLQRRVDDTEMQPALNELVEIAASALDDTRELSRLLRPPVLDDLGLLPALSWLRRTLGQRVGLDVRLSEEIEDETFEPDIETLVFRVVQEALTNTVKHAGVSTAWVSLHRDGDTLCVIIEDHGAGFDVAGRLRPGGSTDSTGLRGMRDRVALFGGRLDIESGRDAGTRLTLRVPLDGVDGNSGVTAHD